MVETTVQMANVAVVVVVVIGVVVAVGAVVAAVEAVGGPTGAATTPGASMEVMMTPTMVPSVKTRLGVEVPVFEVGPMTAVTAGAPTG